MPQLPGGRHVAINATPLAALLDDANNPVNAQKIMAINSPHDLEAYIEPRLSISRFYVATGMTGGCSELLHNPLNHARRFRGSERINVLLSGS
jgi:hypothetical protein